MARRIAWQLPVTAALVALLAALATLQYRWLGDVSQAERERMRTSMRARASDFAEAFDRDLARTYIAFHVDTGRLEADPAGTLADAFTHWQSAASAPGLVEAVYLLEGQGPSSWSLRRLDPAHGVLEPVEWPPSLERWRARVRHSLPGMPALLLNDALDATIPALFVHTPDVTTLDDGRSVKMLSSAGASERAIVVVLNQERLRSQVLDPLVTKYFGKGDESEYVLTIVRRDEPSHVVYASDPRVPAIDDAGADVVAGLFDLRLDELARLNVPAGLFRSHTATSAKMAITIVRRGPGDAGGLPLTIGGPQAGAWQARVRYRSGPLDAIVAASRRRNLAIGLGVLALLAASFVLIIASAQRQQRLARQQIEFVAAVSHELRTPLAVIRSAGENLADGVVAGDDQVKRYGSLIESEGRRLTDMVERVLEFAGIASGWIPRARAEVDVAGVITDVADRARADGRDRGIEVASRVAHPLPMVTGDADALRSALQNVVGNAIKYSPNGASVEVTAQADQRHVRVTVVDRGLGIDADELPHVFKPFFRGRRAVDAQIRGTGVGLSVVRYIVRAHQGRVHLVSRPGEGTTVTIELPIAAQPEPAPAAAAARNVSA